MIYELKIVPNVKTVIKRCYLLYFCMSVFITIFDSHLYLRQLEAIIRISESLAKMGLAPYATEAHVDEALRLFQVSTLDAAMSGSLSGNSIKMIYCAAV